MVAAPVFDWYFATPLFNFFSFETRTGMVATIHFEKLYGMDKGKANMIADKIKNKIEELKPNDANTKPA